MQGLRKIFREFGLERRDGVIHPGRDALDTASDKRSWKTRRLRRLDGVSPDAFEQASA